MNGAHFSTTNDIPTTGKNRAREAGDGWRLDPHVCRSCFSRIVSRPTGDEDGTRVYQCTNCGLEAVGRKADVVCSCGTKLRKGGRAKPVLVDAGIRCTLNDNPTPEFPSKYVAAQIAPVGSTTGGRNR